MDKDIFISYCWSNEKEADEIDLFFKSKGVELKRDKRDLEFKQSIKEFMRKIREMDFVILVISDEYLKSFNCMYEVLEFLKDDNYKERILPILISNATIYGIGGGLEYIKYWDNELLKLDKSTEGLSHETIIPILENKRRIKKIQDSIVDFIAEISDMKHYKIEELKKINYEPLLTEMNIEGIKNKFLDYENLGQEDDSVGGLKKYSVKIRVNSSYKYEDIKLVVKEVVEEIKKDNYYKSEQAKSHFGDSLADIVTVFVYYRNADISLANYICRAVWNSPLLSPQDSQFFNSKESFNDIEFDWNNSYQEDISMYKPATKGKYLNMVDEIVKEISTLADIVIVKIENMLSNTVDFYELSSIRELHKLSLEKITEKRERVPMPPLECEEFDESFQGIYIFLNNIFIWLSKDSLSTRTETNIALNLKREIKYYKENSLKLIQLRTNL